MKRVIMASLIFLFTFSARAGVFRENFDNGNLDAWQELILTQDFLFLDVEDPPPGSWEIVNGELHAVSPDASTRLLTIGNETWRDYTIEFDVKPLEKTGSQQYRDCRSDPGELGGLVSHRRFAAIS